MRQRSTIFTAAILSLTAAAYASPMSYTDTQGDSLGSTNGGRDIVGATVDNDATNLYITLTFNPTSVTNLTSGNTETPASIATTGYNYAIGITTGAGAGGDVQTNADHGNAYTRQISIDSSLGGMTDWIGIYGAGGSGTTANPYTSYAFNDYVYGTPNDTTTTANAWTKINTGTTGQPMSMTGGDASYNTISLTVPISDFSANLSLTPGITIYFDVYTTGGSGNQTAYDSLADQSATQTGTYSATAQYNGTVLDNYTIQAVPEPASTGIMALSTLAMLRSRRRRA